MDYIDLTPKRLYWFLWIQSKDSEKHIIKKTKTRAQVPIMSEVVEISHGKLASLESPELFTTGARGPHPIYKQLSILQYSSIATWHFLEPLVAHIEFLVITKDVILLTTSRCMKWILKKNPIIWVKTILFYPEFSTISKHVVLVTIRLE